MSRCHLFSGLAAGILACGGTLAPVPSPVVAAGPLAATTTGPAVSAAPPPAPAPATPLPRPTPIPGGAITVTVLPASVYVERGASAQLVNCDHQPRPPRSNLQWQDPNARGLRAP